jgi:hypothetical protein
MSQLVVCKGYKVVYDKADNTFCQNALDCLKYHDYIKSNRYAEVRGEFCSHVYPDLLTCKTLHIIKYLTYEEFTSLLNGQYSKNGETYTLVDGKKNGLYTQIIGGNKTECYYVNDVLHGKWRQILNNTVKVCDYVNGLIEGEFTHTFRTIIGSKYKTVTAITPYKSGVKNGTFRKLDNETGDVLVEVEIVNGEYQGQYKDNIEGIVATYVNGKKNGEYTQSNAETYISANYVDDKLHGEYKSKDLEHDRYEYGFYVNGKRHGVFNSCNWAESRIKLVLF